MEPRGEGRVVGWLAGGAEVWAPFDALWVVLGGRIGGSHFGQFVNAESGELRAFGGVGLGERGPARLTRRSTESKPDGVEKEKETKE